MTADYDAALVVGIAHYPQLRSLQGPVRDAQRVADWLRGSTGLPTANLELVTSDTAKPGQPILDEIDNAFDRIFALAQSWPSTRRLYVYFAGHGCSRTIDHLALLMANANKDYINRSMNATEYRRALAYRLFPEQIYLFDCCRAYDYTVVGRGPEWTTDEAKEALPGLIQLVMYAAGVHELANERNLIYNDRRGLFTEALIEGLNGAAARRNPLTGQGEVTSERLISYVRDRLDQLTKNENLRQHAWLETRGIPRPLVLATGVTPRLVTLKVTVPRGTRRLVVQDEHNGLVLDKRISSSVAEVPELEMTGYTITAQPSGAKKTIRVLPDIPTDVDLGG